MREAYKIMQNERKINEDSLPPTPSFGFIFILVTRSSSLPFPEIQGEWGPLKNRHWTLMISQPRAEGRELLLGYMVVEITMGGIFINGPRIKLFNCFNS